jgi:manganese oxidase
MSRNQRESHQPLTTRIRLQRRPRLFGLTMLGAILLASFPFISNGNSALAASSNPTTNSPAPAAKTVQIQITNYSFTPTKITVPVGSTVVWTNNDLVVHSVTSGNGKPTGLFDHDIAPYATFSYTFTKPGTYPYYCKYHSMTGSIIVSNQTSSSDGNSNGQGSTNSTTGNGASGQSSGGSMGSGMGGMNMSGSGTGSGGVYGLYGSSKDTIAPIGTGSKGEPSLPDGMRLLPYTMQGGYKVFHLTAEPVWWEPSPGKKVEAWAYNGTVPGPEIRVNVGDKVKVIVTTKLPEGTTVHWHGLDVPFSQDGTGESQPDLKPGHSQTYTFTIDVPAGTYIYHSHPMDDMLRQDKLGLFGPFIVEPKGTGSNQTHPGYQREYTLVLNDSPQFGSTINGKLYPSTPVMKAKLGDHVLVHVVNIGSMDHPLSLDGMHFQEIEQDGYPLPAPVWMDTIDTQPGTTYDIQIKASSLGKWLLASSIPDQDTTSNGQLSGMAAILDVFK